MVKWELVKDGAKLVHSGNTVWMKPSGIALDELVPGDLCGMDWATGKQVRGTLKPTAEVTLHLVVCRRQTKIFHAGASGGNPLACYRAARTKMVEEGR